MYIHAPSFAPALTGEEVCRSLAMIGDHVLAVIPKGRDVWEVHVDQQDLREQNRSRRASASWETVLSLPQVPWRHLGEDEGSPARRKKHTCG